MVHLLLIACIYHWFPLTTKDKHLCPHLFVIILMSFYLFALPSKVLKTEALSFWVFVIELGMPCL